MSTLKKKKQKIHIKKVVHDFVYSPPFEIFVVCAIVLSVSLLVIEVSVKMKPNVEFWEVGVARALDIFFIIEYITRIIIAPSKWGFVRKNIIDLIALLPILRFFRLIRILRLIRLAKVATLNQWSTALTRTSKSLGLEMQQKKFEGSIVIIVLIGVILVGSVGILLFEKGHNDHFRTILDGFWWSTVTLTTVGYGDKFPVTVGGRILAIFIMFLGLSCFALITGFTSSFIIQRYRKEEYSGMDLVGFKDHIIVCGWNSNAPTVLKELTHLFNTELKQLIIVAEEQPEYPFSEGIFFVKGDFTKREVLDRARVEDCSAVIILADSSVERNAQDTDARTIVASLAVERIDTSIYTCVEILVPENIDHIINAGVDEYVIAANYTGNLLAHSVKHPGISKVYQELLMSTVGNQIHRIGVPDDLVERSFKDCANEFLESDLGLLIGIERNQEYFINPEDKFIERTDTLVYIAREELSI